MGNNKQKVMSLHDKAMRLLEGGEVSCSGYSVRAIKMIVEDDVCKHCEMFSVCGDEMINLCGACDDISHTKHVLKLVSS